MITKLNSTAPAGDKEGGIGGWILGLGAAALAFWAGYEFWWKPKKEAEAKAAATSNAKSEEQK